ncbi:MAG: nucleotidyltransferase family protein [Clostridia bacterium]|nr:nucleotidyltransferase family protein [Clostridia bacterium]
MKNASIGNGTVVHVTLKAQGDAKVGCVILASGESRRFGGNKLLTPFLGKPLLRHTLETIPPGVAPVVVVTRSRSVDQLAREMGFDVLLHGKPDISDTIRLGLECLLPIAEVGGCMFCVGDQPLCSRETKRRLIAAFSGSPGCIARVCYGATEGSPTLFSRDFFGELSALQPGQSGGTVIRRHPDRLIRVQAAEEWELMDADTPQALMQLDRLAREYGMRKEDGSCCF